MVGLGLYKCQLGGISWHCCWQAELPTGRLSGLLQLLYVLLVPQGQEESPALLPMFASKPPAFNSTSSSIEWCSICFAVVIAGAYGVVCLLVQCYGQTLLSCRGYWRYISHCLRALEQTSGYTLGCWISLTVSISHHYVQFLWHKVYTKLFLSVALCNVMSQGHLFPITSECNPLIMFAPLSPKRV